MRTALVSLAVMAMAAMAASAASCGSSPSAESLGPSTFNVTVTSVNGNPPPLPPPAGSPLPVNNGRTNDEWAFTIQAVSPTGELMTSFNGFVGLSVVPGTVAAVTAAPGGVARGLNILVTNGQAQGTASVTATYGSAYLWVEDLGYVPTPPGQVPQCSNGIDDNHNGLIDYPSDPGCYAPDDNSEDGGTYQAGLSQTVPYVLPTIADVRGPTGTATPYPNEAVNIEASAPEHLVVTGIATDGFFVTDVSPTQVKNGYNSLFAFNFSTPPNMRLCDTITQLSGTANDFYGFMELSFPSWVNTYVILPADAGVPPPGTPVPGCAVPEPIVLSPSLWAIPSKDVIAANLFRYESTLVRLVGWTSAEYIGSQPAVGYNWKLGTNCDFNGDGVIDYAEVEDSGLCPPGQCEGTCSTLCDSDPTCSGWNEFATENAFKVSYIVPGAPVGPSTPQTLVDTSTVSTFDPIDNAGQLIPMVSGPLREFSGGNLNWTVQARCSDDLVCPASLGCTTQVPIPSTAACVRARTTDDNDEGTD